MTRQDAADLLGVPAEASPEVVRQAYRRQCVRLHPDAGGVASQFQLLTRARDILLAEPRASQFSYETGVHPRVFPLSSYPLRILTASIRDPRLRPRAVKTWMTIIIGLPLVYLIAKELFMLAIVPILIIGIAVALLRHPS